MCLETSAASGAYRAKFCEAELNGENFFMAMLAGANFMNANLQ